jgi:hypothetical protein
MNLVLSGNRIYHEYKYCKQYENYLKSSSVRYSMLFNDNIDE